YRRRSRPRNRRRSAEPETETEHGAGDGTRRRNRLTEADHGAGAGAPRHAEEPRTTQSEEALLVGTDTDNEPASAGDGVDRGTVIDQRHRVAGVLAWAMVDRGGHGRARLRARLQRAGLAGDQPRVFLKAAG